MGRFALLLLLAWLWMQLLGVPSSALTNPSHVDALTALQNAWSPTSFSWSGDPCVDQWTGVTCDASNTNVTKLVLPAMEIMGTLPPEISNLNNLEVLDLSYNENLAGNLPAELFSLTSLTQLFLQYCSFMGSLPRALGNLEGLTYLALNHNHFTGPIPDTIGQLSQLFWFDISSNQLTGNLPTSMGNLTNIKHFHLQGNNFIGVIPEGIFNPRMKMVHLLLNNNSFEGQIPTDIGSLPNLDILQLHFNSFTSIPNFTELTTLSAMKLDHNKIYNQPIPNFTHLANLQILDLGHNQFTTSQIPSWFSSLPKLQYLGMESGNLEGGVPTEIFSPSNLTTVLLGHNTLNGTLDLQDAGPNLVVVDVEYNYIQYLNDGSFTGALNLQGNFYCQEPDASPVACTPEIPQPSIQYSACGCSQGLQSNPTAPSGSCLCSYPVSGVLIFIALKVTLDFRVIPTLQAGFVKNIPILTRRDQVSISILSNGMVVNISIFPNNTEVWNFSEANLITALLSSKAILFPAVGPYEYLPSGPYSPPGVAGKRPEVLKIVLIIGAVTLATICIGGYALMQKKRADKAEEVSKPFASWIASGDDNGAAPKVKGARLISLSEVKRATNNFSKSNEIGAGGYGKVYKGVLLSGEQVAIKRAQASSQQGRAEFKTEIELLSRVHHRNLVGLVGFCFEEQMLVYELMPNGTLRDSLSGHTNIKMDWRTRLNVALGSANGLAYLHTEADPPIIHRDVKSSNILLDEKLNAKVADFGLSKLAPNDDGTGNSHVSTQVKGTLGYLDPEYYTSQRLTEKSDVYSFGVVMLELITSKQPIERGKYIVREVRDVIQEKGIPGVQHLQDTHLVDCPIEDLEVFVDVALRCVEEAAVLRPTMRQVVKELETLLAYSKPPAPEQLTPVVAIADLPPENEQKPEDLESAFQYSGGFVVPIRVEPK